MKSERHYRDRAAYLRQVAKDAHTEKLRETCLKAAEQFEALADIAAKEAARKDEDH